MTCPKCAGLMLPSLPIQRHLTTYLMDIEEICSQEHETYHCYACGTYLDPVILANKQSQMSVSCTPEMVMGQPVILSAA